MSYCKGKKFNKKFFKTCAPENQFQDLLCLQKIKHNLYWKMKFLKRATYFRYVITKPSKFAQISMRLPQDPFYREFSENQKGPGTSFQATFFI